MDLVWNAEETYLKYPDNKKIVLFLEQGLPFMWFKDFVALRYALGKSHLQGRKEYEKPEVTVNHALTSLTEDVVNLHEGWSTWVEGDVREEDEVFLGTMGCTDGKDTVSTTLKEKCQWDIHQRGCPKCRKAIGMMRPHHKGKRTSKNVLSCDLSGPHPESVGTKYKYLMVAVFNTGAGGVNLPFVRGLETKSAMSVARAVSNVIAEINRMMGMPIVCRFHSDAGSEFWNKELSQLLDGMGIFQTKTTGYDPQANGRAERYVGLIKRHATSYLVHAGLGLKFWYWASQQAAYMYRCRALEVKLPENAPTFGNRVLVAQRPQDVPAFGETAKEGIFLCWDSSSIQGAFVAVPKPSGGMGIITAACPTPWPGSDGKERWKLVKESDGEGKIWVSSTGRVS